MVAKLLMAVAAADIEVAAARVHANDPQDAPGRK
jgi:hypothetical protein